MIRIPMISLALFNECSEHGPKIISLTREEAIARQRAAGRVHGYEYMSDQQALEDFLAIHGAWEERKKCTP